MIAAIYIDTRRSKERPMIPTLAILIMLWWLASKSPYN